MHQERNPPNQVGGTGDAKLGPSPSRGRVRSYKIRMTILQELAKVSPPKGTVLTIGVFDGVHLGHQYLLKRVSESATVHGLLTAVLTFRNNPASVLATDSDLQYITSLEDRLALIKSRDIDLVADVDFTEEVSLIEAPQFVKLLRESLKMRGLVVGPDFAVGHGREGDIPTLIRLGEEMGFWVETVEPVATGLELITSSGIRDRLVEGDVENASEMLGRWYSLTGLVVEGDRRGRTLGFPTANLRLDGQLVIPAAGIYATWARVEGRRYQAATCIGVRPTFGVHNRTVEAFILDYDGDLYGKSITLEFARRLREERAFPNVDTLVEQMKQDVEQSHAVLSGLPEALEHRG